MASSADHGRLRVLGEVTESAVIRLVLESLSLLGLPHGAEYAALITSARSRALLSAYRQGLLARRAAS